VVGQEAENECRGGKETTGSFNLGAVRVLLEKRTVKYYFEVRNCLRIQIH